MLWSTVVGTALYAAMCEPPRTLQPWHVVHPSVGWVKSNSEMPARKNFKQHISILPILLCETNCSMLDGERVHLCTIFFVVVLLSSGTGVGERCQNCNCNCICTIRLCPKCISSTHPPTTPIPRRHTFGRLKYEHESVGRRSATWCERLHSTHIAIDSKIFNSVCIDSIYSPTHSFGSGFFFPLH